jgi:hypothetical protein
MTALYPLNVVCELLINGTWVDISKFVYQRDDIQISGGKNDNIHEEQTPASMLLTLDNRDGRFTPNNASGQYYPNLQRNVQIRLSVSGATSSSGNTYTGFRFWGDVKRWPPMNDPSGNDIYAKVNCTGPLRRLRSGGGEGSALQRYYASLTGLYAPIAYWPCEEDPNTGLIGTGVQSGATMSVASGTPKFKAISAFNGSAPIGVLNKSIWTGITSAFGTSGNDQFLVPGTYQWIASTTTVDARVLSGGGGGTKGQEGTAAGGSAGGGSAWAGNATLAVTPGQLYTVVVGAGGANGPWNAGASDGSTSSIVGDVASVIADPGKGAGANAAAGTAGLASASTGTALHSGAAGGSNAGHFNGGAGGGSSGGSSAAGNAGSNPTNQFGASGGSAPTGGGAGGNGGGFGPPQSDGRTGGVGGGGGGGWANAGSHTDGAQGDSGSVQLVYTSSGGGTQPNNNVIRFILYVPQKGGNGGKVLVRALTSSSVIARLDCTYVTPGKIRLQGFNGSSVQQFDSGSLSVGADGQTLMVSMELAKSGTAIAWAFSAIIPGQHGVVAKTSGSVASATMGSVSQIVVGPNGDITKTAIGHVSIQYALIPLWKISEALNGHDQETGINRFRRLANQAAMGHVEEYNEGADHWGFEVGTQSWVGTNCALTNPTTTFTDVGGDTWPTHGTHSLLLNAAGTGVMSATSPVGLSGQPVVAGDTVSLSVDMYVPVAINQIFIGLRWYNVSGTFISESDRADFNMSAGEIHTYTLTGPNAVAPTGAAFYAVIVGTHASVTVSTKIYCDHVHTNPAMGPQSHKQQTELFKEMEELEQGIMKEAKTLWGLAYRTRIKLINQSASATLDWTGGYINPDLAPTFDNLNLKNDITVHRHKGNKTQVTLSSGSMSILEPPQGTGRHKKTIKAIAAADEQLAALASHLLLVGTVSDERYPTVSVDMSHCGMTGNGAAPLMSAIAGVEIGDVIQLNNLPAWFPSSSSKQLVIGYSEVINAFNWIITWNCVPYTPYVQVTTNIRKW